MTRAQRIAEMDRKLADLQAANRKREAQLRARKRRLESAERARERKLRTRRLILMGSWMEHVVERDEAARERLMRQLDGFLSRPRDRALFDLGPREGSERP